MKLNQSEQTTTLNESENGLEWKMRAVAEFAEIRKTQQHLEHKLLTIYFRLKSILLQHFSIVTWILFLVFIICLFSSHDDDSKSIVHNFKWWEVQIVNGIGHVSCSSLLFFTQKKNGDIRNEPLNCDEKRCNYYPWSIAMAIYISAV